MHRTGRLKLQITPISLLPAPWSSTIKSPLRQKKKKESPHLPVGGGGGEGVMFMTSFCGDTTANRFISKRKTLQVFIDFILTLI